VHVSAYTDGHVIIGSITPYLQCSFCPRTRWVLPPYDHGHSFPLSTNDKYNVWGFVRHTVLLWPVLCIYILHLIDVTYSMPPSTSLRKTYSSLSPSLMSSDDFHSGGTKEMCTQPSRSSPRTISRHSFLIRITIFALLEFSFIALVSAALHNPIVLNVSLTNTKVTGAVTTIAILWHALAIFVAQDILTTVFSAEWAKQYDRSRYLTLQEYDIVSRLTAGPMDKLKYFVSKRATLPFRLSLLAFLPLLLLNELGPSPIDVEPVPHKYPCTAPIANLTVGLPGDGTVETPASQLANSVLQLEVVQNSATVGFKAKQPNILTPWPSSDFMSKNMSMTYQSDVIRYNFSCSWKIPYIKEDTWVVAGKEWPPYFTAGALPNWPVLSDPCKFFFWLSPVSAGSQNIYSVIFPLWTRFNESTPLTALLFVGRNGTTPSYLNLADIPSLNLPCNTTRNPTYLGGKPRECNPISVSVLMCDPQPEVLPDYFTWCPRCPEHPK
jgi:uncharacterized membrane protein (DUF485 family)